MIERVASVLADWSHDDYEADAEAWNEMARVAITAMRKPTTAMMNATPLPAVGVAVGLLTAAELMTELEAMVAQQHRAPGQLPPDRKRLTWKCACGAWYCASSDPAHEHRCWRCGRSR